MKILLVLLLLSACHNSQETDTVLNQENPDKSIIEELEQLEGITSDNQNSDLQPNIDQEQPIGTDTQEDDKVVDEEIKEIDEKEQEKTKIDADNFREMLDILRPLFGLREFDEDSFEENSLEEGQNDVAQQSTETNKEEISNYEYLEGMEVVTSGIMDEWDQIMGDFEPEDMLSFEIGPGQSEVLYEYIPTETTMRGAYFIPAFKKQQKIDFTIKSDKNDVIYTKDRQQEGIFKVDVPKGGEYKFIFSNKRSKEKQTVTFALDVHNSTREHLKMQDLDPIAFRIERIHVAMRDNYFYKKMADEKMYQNNIILEEAVYKLFFYSIIEVFGIIAITLWQVYYVKKIIGNQRLI